MHPHLLRHTFADRWQAAGESESDLMQLAGWKSPAILRRYANSAAMERAHAPTSASGWETSCETDRVTNRPLVQSSLYPGVRTPVTRNTCPSITVLHVTAGTALRSKPGVTTT
jgi:hypothetical protein